MNAEEIDKIIEEAQSADKKLGKSSKKEFPTEKVRAVLNALFIIAAVATVVVYFMKPDDKALFYMVGFGALGIKIVEFIIRFTL